MGADITGVTPLTLSLSQQARLVRACRSSVRIRKRMRTGEGTPPSTAATGTSLSRRIRLRMRPRGTQARQGELAGRGLR